MTKPLVHVDSWERNFRSRNPTTFLKLKKVVQIDFRNLGFRDSKEIQKQYVMPNCILWDSIYPVPELFCAHLAYIYIYTVWEQK